MKLTANSGVRGTLIDLDTLRVIRKVKWADVPEDPRDQGEYEAFRLDGSGKIIREPVIRPDGSTVLMPQTYRGRCRLKFLPGEVLRPRVPEPDPEDERRFAVAMRLRVPMFGDRCEHYGCSRAAIWSVSDEVGLPPLYQNGRLFVRARCVGRRYYCPKHYKPARLLDAKGEVIKEYEDGLGVRPGWHS